MVSDAFVAYSNYCITKVACHTFSAQFVCNYGVIGQFLCCTLLPSTSYLRHRKGTTRKSAETRPKAPRRGATQCAWYLVGSTDLGTHQVIHDH